MTTAEIDAALDAGDLASLYSSGPTEAELKKAGMTRAQYEVLKVWMYQRAKVALASAGVGAVGLVLMLLGYRGLIPIAMTAAGVSSLVVGQPAGWVADTFYPPPPFLLELKAKAGA